MKNALELQNVSKSFKGFETKDMTFSLQRQNRILESFWMSHHFQNM